MHSSEQSVCCGHKCGGARQAAKDDHPRSTINALLFRAGQWSGLAIALISALAARRNGFARRQPWKKFL
jgi:hypothetical protein